MTDYSTLTNFPTQMKKTMEKKQEIKEKGKKKWKKIEALLTTTAPGVSFLPLLCLKKKKKTLQNHSS